MMRSRWMIGGVAALLLMATAVTAFAVHQQYQGLPVVRVLLDRNPVKSDVPPVILDGRTLLPVRAVAEALGLSVHWDEELSTVYLSTASPGTPAIATQAAAAIAAIRDQNWSQLASLIHPVQGVRFSPYGYVRMGPGGDRVLTQAQIQAGFADTNTYLWGHYDGTGDPIQISFEDYWQEFVYSAGFAAAPVISYNSISGRGNTLINLHQAYPQGQFVEYHFPGFDPQYGGMDWQSLRLVFEELHGNWMLVGIIHDEWTI